MKFSLGPIADRVDRRLRQWEAEQFARRLWAKDPTIWSPTQVPEIADRLGWLDLPQQSRNEVDKWDALRREVIAEGITSVLLLGMGGSSLAPEVFQDVFGNAPGHPQLLVLDTTHPAAISDLTAHLRLDKCLFVVSSKSGTTIETMSLFRYFYGRLSEITGTPGRHFVAVFDPGTPLEELGRAGDFRDIFVAPQDVGGRYSALSTFGLLPATLIGIDTRELLARSAMTDPACSDCVSSRSNQCLALGAALGELALAGKDKITLITSQSLSAFPLWVEQLLAESTGKNGKGIIPVVDEPLEVYSSAVGTDRVFVHISLRQDADQHKDLLKSLESDGHPVIRIVLSDNLDLGAEMFRWEMATAAACAILGVHPFNQPDVELAKQLARIVMAESQAGGPTPTRLEDHTGGDMRISGENPKQAADSIKRLLANTKPGDYVALQAFLAPTFETTRLLQAIRWRLGCRTGLATTLGYGPRFLHSTGQLHKGGPDTGIFIQLVDRPRSDLKIPEAAYSFGDLIEAQSLGDYQALRRRGRRVLRIHLGANAVRGLQALANALA
ncbi:MAG: hypothetical protein V1694_11685 [Candidatus Eisenbacteria bacterium]